MRPLPALPTTEQIKLRKKIWYFAKQISLIMNNNYQEINKLPSQRGGDYDHLQSNESGELRTE